MVIWYGATPLVGVSFRSVHWLIEPYSMGTKNWGRSIRGTNGRYTTHGQHLNRRLAPVALAELYMMAHSRDLEDKSCRLTGILRFQNAEMKKLAIIAEIYNSIPPKIHPFLQGEPKFGEIVRLFILNFITYLNHYLHKFKSAAGTIRSSSVHVLCKTAPFIFDYNLLTDLESMFWVAVWTSLCSKFVNPN